jgi:sugar phosphate isomerase/epimerase
VQLGRGLAEFPELLGILEEHQYRGFITIERRQGENTVAEIADAVRYLKSL